MTHADLIHAARKWLAGTHPVVVTDMTHQGSETPDAIGWRNGVSTLVECKASVADYRADAHKHFRRAPETGMGRLRYYLTPPGLLIRRTPGGMNLPRCELPAGWGLLELHGKRVLLIKKAERQAHSHFAEAQLLTSALRRVCQGREQGMRVRIYTEGAGQPARASITVEPDRDWEI